MSRLSEPTPTDPGIRTRLADFTSIADALDYAARGAAGLNIYSGRGELREVLPYALLREQAVTLARRLLALGLRPGERIGLLAESDGDFARTFYACQYAGLVPAPLPLPVAFGGKEGYIAFLRRMIQSADAHAVFCPEILKDWLNEAVAGIGLKFSGTIAALENAPLAPQHALPPPDPDSLAYLQFSSGSTRFPVGVAVTQRALMANAHGMARHGLHIGPRDRATTWLPFYHDMGLVGFFLMPMACQSTIDILPTREFARRPLLWLQLISRNRSTISFSPSFGYEVCTKRARTASTEGIDLSTWRHAGIGGDMIRPNVLTRFAERFAVNGFSAKAFTPCYGMAEATLALTFTPEGQGAREDRVDGAILEREQRAVPADAESARSRAFIVCGKMLPLHEIEIRDETGAPLPEREVGRIFVRGPSLMLGYFHAAEETARVLSPEGWLDTGDLGYLLNGQVVPTGRAKDLVIINGRNLWPQDLEWTAEAEIPGLRSGDVAVFSVDDGEDEEVIALVTCRVTDPAGREALVDGVTRFFRGRHGLDIRVVPVPPHSLPQTSSGKLSRTRARAMFLAGAFGFNPSVEAAE